MRSLLVLAGLLCCLALTPSSAPGQPPPPLPGLPQAPGPTGDVWQVVTPTAEVRCGATDKFPVTDKLKPGDWVEVIREGPQGWLTIRPPRATSFSLIKTSAITVSPNDKRVGVVTGATEAKVPVWAGSWVEGTDTNVKVTELANGTLVTIVGSRNDNSPKGSVTPIAPTANEERYILANQVRKVDASTLASAVAPAVGPNPKVTLAEQHIREARKHLLDAYNAATDPATKKDLYDKLTLVPIIQEANTTPNNVIKPIPNTVPPVYHQTATQPGNGIPPINANTATPSAAPAWSQWGTLKKSEIQKDGQQYYVLLSPQGEALEYAVAAANFTLQTHAGKMVALYGPASYRGDVGRIQVRTVTHVAVP